MPTGGGRQPDETQAFTFVAHRHIPGGDERPGHRSVAAQTAPHVIYVSNEKDNTLSVINGESLEVTDVVKVGQRPRGITLSKDRKLLYICASDDDEIQVLDVDTLRVTGKLPSGPDPELMVLSPDGRHCTSPTRTTISSPSWSLKRARSRARYRSGLNPKAWVSAPTANPGQHLGDNQYGAFHRYLDGQGHR